MKKTSPDCLKPVLCLAAILLFGTLARTQTPTVPTPPQTDQIILDNNSNSKADPGDKVRYQVTIQNTGSGNANGVQLNAVPDPRTTLDGTSFRTSPLAMPDAYDCLGNVGITVPDGASDLLANDYDDAPAGLTATAGTFSTAQGGSITIATNGSFSYNPPRGYTGTDTYTYTLNDGNDVDGAGPIPGTDMATITITVSGLVWFINNNAGACASFCDGRMSNPYTSLSAFNTANDGMGFNPKDNHVIFIYESSTAYAGGIVLRNGQKLFGQDATVSLDMAAGLTVPTFSNALPTTNSASPFATIANSSGDGVTLADGNTLRGFRVGDCSDFGIENSGTNSVGNLVVSEVTINNTTGGGFDASHGSGSGMSAVFASISSTGGANGILLATCMGTFTANGGTITNPTGTGVLISGGSVVFSTSGAITDNTGFAVVVDDHDSGNATFSGNITSTGTGISVQNCGGGTKTFSGSSKSLSTGSNTAVALSSNTGATVNITNGGLVISTTSGTGFNATGGGTVTVQGTGNTINSGSGTALNVSSTTIGASGITFQSISKNGGTNNAIALSSTGSGTFTISGTGSAGSGGTIENISGADAISLNNTDGLVSLSSLIIEDISHANDASAANDTNSGVDGIHGQNVDAGLSLNNCTIRRISDSAINGTGANTSTTTPWVGLSINNSTLENCNRFHVTNRADQAGEGVVHILGISGTVSVLNSTLQNGARGLHFYSATSGSIDMTVQNTDFLNLYKDIESINDSWGVNAIELRMFGSCGAVARIGDPNETNAALGCQFTNASTSSISIFCHDNSYSGTIRTVISRNIFTVTDHISPGTLGTNAGFDGEFPQGGVLLQCLGGAMEGVFSHNEFHDCMHAFGGVGNLTLISGESSDTEFRVNNNTFDGPWDFINELRSDNNTSCAILWKDNIMPFKNLTPAQIVGTELAGMGLTSQPLPFESFFVDVRNNGFMDLTIQNENVPDHDRPNNSSSDNSFHFRTNNGTLNLEMDNNKATNGYQLQHNSGTFNLFRDGSGAGTAQLVLLANGNLGGSVNPNTSPPVVNQSGTITLSNTDPVLPSIGPF
jgi:uncharacterized repeat protein (TIGR01451 family)